MKTAKAKSRLRRILLRVAIASPFVLAACGVAASYIIDWACELHPPKLTYVPAILSMPLVEADGIRTIGDNSLSRRDGIIRMKISGDPYTLGYANAVLTQEYVREQETQFLALIRQFVPSDWKLWLLKKFIVVRNRGLDQYIAPDRLMEIYGLSQGYNDPFPEIGPLYHRLVNYHAAHDIGHALIDNPLLGCTSFAVSGPYTANGHLWTGRNFDFDAARCFDENKIVMLVTPDDGLRFLSVGWPGLVGVVTGLNEKLIFASLNAAHSEDSARIGTPVSLVLREVMQHASTLDEAVSIIVNAQVFVSDSYLVADGKTGQAALVEKTPARSAVVRWESDAIVNTNHFLSPQWGADAGNLAYIREGTSVDRYQRTVELLDEYKGALDEKTIAAILRDRSVPGVPSAGLGNQAAINPLVATHSVIADVTAGIIWVSASPHQLGAYVPFSISSFDAPSGAEAVPADALLTDGGYDAFLEARAALASAQKALDEGDAKTASALAGRAMQANPGYYEPYLVMGKAALALKDYENARKYLDAALAAYPPYQSQRDEVTALVSGISQAPGK